MSTLPNESASISRADCVPAGVLPGEPSLRKRMQMHVLIAATVLVLYLCYGVLKPFIPVFSWALALAVVAHPLHKRIVARAKNDNGAALLTTCAIGIGILIPLGLVIRQVVREGVLGATFLAEQIQEGSWDDVLSRKNRELLTWLDQNFRVREGLQDLATRAGAYTTTVFSGSIWSAMQLFLILFTCFFFFRDRRQILQVVRGLVPLSRSETDEVFSLVDDTVHATIYGTIVVAAVQGTLGGLMFWWLELPAPVLWAMVMAILAVVPYLGAFLVWGPAALYLALQGDWLSATLLTTWGALAVGLIDNLLYPFLVGKKLRFHTLPVFFFILGGVYFFGAAGIVLGPVVLAIADALRDIWRRRLAMADALAAAAAN